MKKLNKSRNLNLAELKVDFWWSDWQALLSSTVKSYFCQIC